MKHLDLICTFLFIFAISTTCYSSENATQRPYDVWVIARTQHNLHHYQERLEMFEKMISEIRSLSGIEVDFHFEDGTGLIEYEKTVDENLSDIVTNLTKACTTFDSDCEKFVLNLNGGRERISIDDLNRIRGKVVVPTLEKRAFVQIYGPLVLDRDSLNRIEEIKERYSTDDMYEN